VVDQVVDGRNSKIGAEVDCDDENANRNNMEWQVPFNMVLQLRLLLKAGNFFTS
jgi:hypothetical protein